MLKCVKKLRPGCTLTVSANGVILKDRFHRTPQFDPDVLPSDPDPRAMQSQIDGIVADQMVADVEVGALLSGGELQCHRCRVLRATDPSKS